MNDESQSKLFSRGHRDATSVCHQFFSELEAISDWRWPKFTQDIRLRLSSHEDFHTAISFLSKDAGLRYVENDQDDPSFILQRPQSQMTFSSSQPAPGFNGPSEPRPRSVILPPYRPSSQASNRPLGQKLPVSQSRPYGLSLSQENNMFSFGSEHSSRPGPMFRHTPGSLNQSIHPHQRLRLASASGGGFVEGAPSFSRLPQSIMSSQQQSRSAGNYHVARRLQSFEGVSDQMREEDDRVLSLQNPRQLQQEALSWQTNENLGTFGANAVYSGELRDEPSNSHAAVLSSQRRQYGAALDTAPNISPEVLESDWSATATLAQSPTFGAPKRRGPSQARPPSILKKPRHTGNVVKSQTANMSQSPKQPAQSTSGAITALRQRALQTPIPLQNEDTSSTIEKPKYASSACMRCRRKHRKCDRVLPICGGCARDNFQCIQCDQELVGNAVKKALPDAISGVGHEACQTSFMTSMQDSGIQLEVDTQDEASQTMIVKDCIKVADAGTNTMTQVSDRGVQTDVGTKGRLSIAEWSDLVTAVRTLGDHQVGKGAQWLQCSTGFAGEYQERLEAAAACGTGLVRGMIDLYERAVKDSR